MPDSAAAAVSNAPKLRAAAYLRVSTEEQSQGLSLDSQREAIFAAAAHPKCTWEVVDIGHDHASGKSLKRRPGLARLLDELDAGELDVLVIARFDRLSRSVWDFYGITDRANRKGWALVCLVPGLDMTTPHGKLFAGMVALFAEYERELISERQKESVRARKAAGTYKAPAPLVSEAAVARMRALRAEGLSYGRIADRLTLEGFPAPTGGLWWRQTVYKVLTRTVPQDVGPLAAADDA